jgi:hypothetical protein
MSGLCVIDWTHVCARCNLKIRKLTSTNWWCFCLAPSTTVLNLVTKKLYINILYHKSYYCLLDIIITGGGSRSRDRMVVGFTTICAISAYHHLSCGFEPLSWRGVQHYVIVCQWLATGRWFSLGTPISFTNNTDCHNITEIFLKVVLNTINPPKKPPNHINRSYYCLLDIVITCKITLLDSFVLHINFFCHIHVYINICEKWFRRWNELRNFA